MTVNEFIQELAALDMGDAELLFYDHDFIYCEKDFGPVVTDVGEFPSLLRTVQLRLLSYNRDTQYQQTVRNTRQAVVIMRDLDAEIENRR